MTVDFIQISNTNSERIVINNNFSLISGLLSRVLTADVNIADFPATPNAGQTVLFTVTTGVAATLNLTGHFAVFTGSEWVVTAPSSTSPPIPTDNGLFIPNGSLDGWIPYSVTATATPSIIESGITVNEETLAADKVLTDTDAVYQFIDPDGSNRTITLPVNGVNKRVVIQATGNTPFTITVLDDTSATINILTDQSGSVFRAEYISSATNWYVNELTRI